MPHGWVLRVEPVVSMEVIDPLGPGPRTNRSYSHFLAGNVITRNEIGHAVWEPSVERV